MDIRTSQSKPRVAGMEGMEREREEQRMTINIEGVDSSPLQETGGGRVAVCVPGGRVRDGRHGGALLAVISPMYRARDP